MELKEGIIIYYLPYVIQWRTYFKYVLPFRSWSVPTWESFPPYYRWSTSLEVVSGFPKKCSQSSDFKFYYSLTHITAAKEALIFYIPRWNSNYDLCVRISYLIRGPSPSLEECHTFLFGVWQPQICQVSPFKENSVPCFALGYLK